jgi:hypothetical protein
MHVQTDIFCSGGLTLPDKGGRQLTIGGWAEESTFGVRLYFPKGSLCPIRQLGGLVNWHTFFRPNVNIDQLTYWFPIDK